MLSSSAWVRAAAHDTRPDHRVIVRVRPKKPLALAMNDMAADLSNGASGSTLHVGTLKYTTGLRPVQKVNSGFLSAELIRSSRDGASRFNTA